jgi:hypothetical protein
LRLVSFQETNRDDNVLNPLVNLYLLKPLDMN